MFDRSFFARIARQGPQSLFNSDWLKRSLQETLNFQRPRARGFLTNDIFRPLDIPKIKKHRISDEGKTFFALNSGFHDFNTGNRG